MTLSLSLARARSLSLSHSLSLSLSYAYTHTNTHAHTHTRTHAQTGLVRTRAHLTTTAQTFVEHVTNVSARQPFVQRFAGLTPPKKAQGRLLLKDRATERDTQRQRERDSQTSAFHKIRIGSDFDEDR